MTVMLKQTRSKMMLLKSCLVIGTTIFPFVSGTKKDPMLHDSKLFPLHVGTSLEDSKLHDSYHRLLKNYYGSNNYNHDYDMVVDVCSDSVVVVTSMSIQCDSPYTFYYGNGAHRSSPICDYGDKATLYISVNVVDDLQEGDNEIYFILATYDDSDNTTSNLLTSSSYPESLCEDYVGDANCIKQGSYSFTYKFKLNTPYSGNNNKAIVERTKFVPYVQMAFSTKNDYGYNLGAVNIECQDWDQDQPVSITWGNNNNSNYSQQFQNNVGYITQNGMLIGTIMLLSTFALYVWYKSLAKQSPTVSSSSISDYVIENDQQQKENSQPRSTSLMSYEYANKATQEPDGRKIC